MYRFCLLCRFWVMLMIHIVVMCQMISEHGAYMSTESRQQNAFYALRSCHQVLHGDSGEFFSPDYLCSNPALWCNWTIQVQPGKRMQLYLEDLTPEHMCHLKTDQIHVDEFPVSAGERHILERCWRSSMYTSFSNRVHVVQLIRPNPNPPHRGFYGAYQAFGLPGSPDLQESSSEEGRVRVEEPEAEDPVTKIPAHKSFSNELKKTAADADIEHAGVSHSISPQQSQVLTVTAGTFREIRKTRSEAPFHGTSPRDDFEYVDELVSVPTGVPSLITVEMYNPTVDAGPLDPQTLSSTYTTHTIPTSTVTTVKQSTKKRVPKRKPVLNQSPPTMATMNKIKLTSVSQAATQTPDGPTEAKMAGSSTPLVEDVGTVFMEMPKINDARTLAAASEEHVGGFPENEPNAIKTVKSHDDSLPVQTFRLATEPPHVPGECSRTSVPMLLYVICFLLCFLITLLLAALGMMYRRYHHGTFLPHCRHSSSIADTDVNNNPNLGIGGARSTSRSPPPPPPLPMSGGPRDLCLVRFSPLTPSDGFEGKSQNEAN